MTFTTYVGSYTAPGHPDGIHVLESDAETGRFRVLGALAAVEQPIYMALNRDATMLYTAAVRTAFGPATRNGGLAAFRLGGARGERLELVDALPTGWTGPCHLSLDPAERTLVYAEYTCGTAGYVDLRADGTFDPACGAASETVNPRTQVKHEGVGPNLPRQNAAHAHCAVVTPDGKYLLVVDLTFDRVVAYDFAHRAEGLREVPAASIDTRRFAPGAGPRHIVFHPNGRLAFVVFELHSRVASFRYTGEGFELVEIHDLIPSAARDVSKAAAVKISADGTQVFCSNRGDDSIAVFDLDPATGRMEHLNTAKLEGRFPRDFEFFPGGRFCLVGLKESWRIASYAYDRAKGTFERVMAEEGIFRPLYFRFRTV